MDKVEIIMACFISVPLSLLGGGLLANQVVKAYRAKLKAKVIEKHGYPPEHCDALGEGYEEESYVKKLRDRVAAQAMSALIRVDHAPEQEGTEVMDIHDVSDWAYRYADAMLKARKKKREVSNG